MKSDQDDLKKEGKCSYTFPLDKGQLNVICLIFYILIINLTHQKYEKIS